MKDKKYNKKKKSKVSNQNTQDNMEAKEEVKIEDAAVSKCSKIEDKALKDVPELTEEIKKLETEKKTLTNELESLNKSKKTLTGELENLNKSKKTLTGELENLNKSKKTLTGELENLNKNKEILSDKLESLNKNKEQLSTEVEELKDTKKTFNDEMEKKQKELLDRMTVVENKEASACRNFIDEKLNIVTEITEEYEKSKAKLEESMQNLLKTSVDRVKNEIGESSKLLQTFEIYKKELAERLDTELASFKDKCIQEITKVKELGDEYIQKKTEYQKKSDSLDLERIKVNIDKSAAESLITTFRKEKEEWEKCIKNMEQVELHRWSEMNDDIRVKLTEKFKESFNELQAYKAAEEIAKIRYNLKDAEDVKRMADDIRRLEKEKDRLLDELANKPSDVDLKEFAYANKRIEELEKINLQLEEKNKENKSYEYEINILKLDNKLLEAENIKYKALENELEELKVIHGDISLDETKLSSVVEPYFPPVAEEDSTNISEIDWLNRINEKCNESGYIFDNRLLYAFHTALKISNWSPLTVLAGVSGIGKSSLPKLYSRFGGIYFLKVPVQPDWDSPQATFGYFDPLKNKFNATPILRTMVQASEEYPDNLNDRLVMILLDEMNLAHVELYFSDMLSKLEDRRDGEEPTIEIDIGAGEKRFPVKLSQNVFWVGTMNEDETTATLSDKVIDRGNVLTLPAPEKFTSRTTENIKEAFSKISLNLWNKWLNSRVVFEENQIGFYKETLEKLNTELRKINKGLGNRIWQTVENYMSNYPLVIKYCDDEAKLIEAMNQAFEDAIVQKVMPKLRGIELDGTSKTILNNIEQILASEGYDNKDKTQGNEKANEESKAGKKDKNKSKDAPKPKEKKLPPKTAKGLVPDFNKSCSNSSGSFVWSSSEYLKNGMERVK